MKCFGRGKFAGPGGLPRLRVCISATFLLACCARFATAQPASKPDTATQTPSSQQPFILGPPKGDGPVVVHASFHLLNISGIADEAETVDFSGILTLEWKDPRSAFDPAREGVDEKVLSGSYQVNEIAPGWYPQVLLANAAGRYESRAVLFRIKPDGTSILTEAVDTAIKVDLDMRRYPFDRQRLEAVFDVLGYDIHDVVLETTPAAASVPGRIISVPQWTLKGIGASMRRIDVSIAGGTRTRYAFVVAIDVERQSLFMLRLVVIPLAIIVMLSWSVFWMDRSSLGDRMSVSFVGILTAVAYQITLGGILPHVSYVTLTHAFLNLSMFSMSTTVIVNLVVGAAEKRGDSQRAVRIDRICRRVFPVVYAGGTALLVAAVFLFA